MSASCELSTEEIRKRLCRKFCAFYKETKTEDLSCQGFVTVEKIIRQGRQLPFDTVDKTDRKISKEIEQFLIQEICNMCPFFENDCDFIQYGWKSTPCGGYIFLGELIKRQIISVDNIRDMR